MLRIYLRLLVWFLDWRCMYYVVCSILKLFEDYDADNKLAAWSGLLSATNVYNQASQITAMI